MLFAVMGFFKPGHDTLPLRLEPELNEHFSQPYFPLKLAGKLKNREGKSVGMMVCLEAAGFDQAEAFLRASPYSQSKMYERVEVLEYSVEVGTI